MSYMVQFQNPLIEQRIQDMNQVFQHYNEHYNVTSGLNTLAFTVLPNLKKEKAELQKQLVLNGSDFLHQRLFGIDSSIIYIESLIDELKKGDMP